MKNFAMTGVGGYIAPRHLQAIKETGNSLKVALDPHDSVGILDRFFPEASYFTEFERFDRHLEKLRRGPDSERIDYVSICAPNNLHDAHIRLALRVGANALCEKPLVLNPWNLDALQELERETSGRVCTILQLRVHPALKALKERLSIEKAPGRHKVDLTYVTSRGPWYRYSWKGAVEKSGGLTTNIGIHFFDLLIWLFGPVGFSEVHCSDQQRASGFLELRDADVRWYLSIARADVPPENAARGKTTFRSITMDGAEIEFTDGFTDLHTRVYEETLAGRGFGIEDARPSVTLVQQIRESPVVRPRGEFHPMLSSQRAKG